VCEAVQLRGEGGAEHLHYPPRQRSPPGLAACGHLHISQVIEASVDGQVTIVDIEGGTEISIAPDTIYGTNVGMLSGNPSNPARLQWAVLDTLAKTVRFVTT